MRPESHHLRAGCGPSRTRAEVGARASRTVRCVTIAHSRSRGAVYSRSYDGAAWLQAPGRLAHVRPAGGAGGPSSSGQGAAGTHVTAPGGCASPQCLQAGLGPSAPGSALSGGPWVGRGAPGPRHRVGGAPPPAPRPPRAAPSDAVGLERRFLCRVFKTRSHVYDRL